jgi:hypothetical protein
MQARLAGRRLGCGEELLEERLGQALLRRA